MICPHCGKPLEIGKAPHWNYLKSEQAIQQALQTQKVVNRELRKAMTPTERARAYRAKAV